MLLTLLYAGRKSTVNDLYSRLNFLLRPPKSEHGKNGFVTATKLGTTNDFLSLEPKILLQRPNVLLIELNILLL